MKITKDVKFLIIILSILVSTGAILFDNSMKYRNQDTEQRLFCLTRQIDNEGEFYMEGDGNLTTPYKKIRMDIYHNCVVYGGKILL